MTYYKENFGKVFRRDDMIRWLYRIFGRFWYIFVAAIMVAAFIIFMLGKKQLSVYDSEHGKSRYTIEEEDVTEKPIVSSVYRNDTVDLSMRIPDGWTRVTKDGFDTFMHAPSASSIQVQVINYYPMVNDVTADSLAADLAERGYELAEFSFMDESSYYDVYKKADVSGITDYVEHVFWDRSHVVKLLAVFNDAIYERIRDEIWFCIDSMEWNCEDPIPEGYFLDYRIYGDFEYAIPSGWITGSSETTLYAYDEETGAGLTVNVIEDPAFLSSITELDYASFLSNGRRDFMLNVFDRYDDYIYGEATYTNDGVQTAIMQSYYANGEYQYIITYEFPVDAAEYYYPLVSGAMALTRIFHTPDPSAAAQTEAETERKAEGTPESALFDSPFFNSFAEEKVTEAPPSENVSSLAAALMQVAYIPEDKAAAVSSKWEELGLGEATYAQAVKENDTMIVVLITDALGINYYLYMTKGGDLSEIRANTEDGNVIWSA